MLAHDLCGLAVGISVLLGVRSVLRRSPSATDKALFGSWALSLLLFWAFGGSVGLGPGLHYGLALVVPALLVAGRVVAEGVAGSALVRRMTLTGGFAAAGLLAASFWSNYFVEFSTTGGRGHRTFKTGAEEPKAAALAAILRGAPPDGKTTIVSTDWWCAWPLQYLAAGHPEVECVEGPPAPVDLARGLREGRLYGIEYSECSGHSGLRHLATIHGCPFVEWTVPKGITVLSRDRPSLHER